MNIKVSVIVSILNGENGLRDVLLSIKNQTFKDIQVIMVDACSTDTTAKIMNDFCSDSRFEYHHIDDDSVSKGRNLGIELSKGKYIAFGDENVIFSKNYISSMYNCAEKEGADLCVSQMTSSDFYGEHEFTSSKLLTRRKRTDKFDMDLIWNPAVTNKLFLKEKIIEQGFKFSLYGKGREVAFSLPFVFKSDIIACPNKGLVTYISPVSKNDGTYFKIKYYLRAYEYVIAKAEEAFAKEIVNSVTEFDTQEVHRQRTCYLDEIYKKEITVLLYSYYRHFWKLTDLQIEKFTEIILNLMSKLSNSGMESLKKLNNDIFYGKTLINNKIEMSEKAKITVCVGKSEKFESYDENKLAEQINAIFNQTMPCFQLWVDSRLKDIFPKRWIDNPNVRFIEAKSLCEFKDKALEQCNTNYIVYQDFFTFWSEKTLMYHYRAIHGKAKFGFTTSPISKYTDKKVARYTFSKLSFKYNKKSTHAHHDDMHSLDLFFCNKLFRVKHLKGIYFTFSDNSILDMYKIYENSRFKKLTCSGVYLPYNEDQIINIFKAEENFLPSECKTLYKKYKSIYFRRYSVKKRVDKVNYKLTKFRLAFIKLMALIITSFYRKRKIKNRVFIYSNRSNGQLIENLAKINEGLNCDKIVFNKMFPHSFFDKLKLKKYLLTSKVIVTDDNMKYLRREKLRPEQKVVQAWYSGGAFKRFGVDAPSKISRIDEFKSHSQYTDVCVSSEYVRQFYAHAFGIDINKIKATGTPRSDDIMNKSIRAQKKAEMIFKHPLLKDKKVYLYFPTLRESDGEIVDFDPKIDWDRLNDELADDEIFLISRHPMMLDFEFIKGQFYSRIKDYSFETMSELLAVADAIVTDYSSTIFDAALLYLPMVFYCPDFETFERDFYLDYEKDLPGEIIKEDSQLLTALRNAHGGKTDEMLRAFKEREMGACDGKSTQRVVDLIQGYLK